jgi:hypothetical protein
MIRSVGVEGLSEPQQEMLHLGQEEVVAGRDQEKGKDGSHIVDGLNT